MLAIYGDLPTNLESPRTQWWREITPLVDQMHRLAGLETTANPTALHREGGSGWQSIGTQFR
jgi:hypothetical protein